MDLIVAFAFPTILFGGAALVAAPLEHFFFKTKKGKQIFEALYRAIKDGRI